MRRCTIQVTKPRNPQDELPTWHGTMLVRLQHHGSRDVIELQQEIGLPVLKPERMEVTVA